MSTNRNLLAIKYPNHNIKKNARITLSGLEQPEFVINTISQFKIDDTITEVVNVVFEEGSSYVTFICDSDNIGSFDPMFKLSNEGIIYSDLEKYDTSDMFVTISGFTVTLNGLNYFGNVPINFLNSTHRIYFTTSEKVNSLINLPDDINNPYTSAVLKITGFYIKLSTPFFGSGPDQSYVVKLIFNYIGGMSVNRMNAEFPIDTNHATGYHKVHSVTKDTIFLQIPKKPYYVDNVSKPIQSDF